MASVARPNPSPVRSDRILGGLLLLGAVAYAIFLYCHGSPIAGGSDSSGYLNSARLLEQHRFFADVRVPAGHGHADFSLGAFQPLGFVVDAKLPRMVPTYPLGLPLHLLAAAKLVGWDRAALIVNVFVALGSGGVLWLLARHFDFSRSWAAFAVVWLWLSPQMIFCALQPMSDTPALFWSLVVLYSAIRSREGSAWCFGCGMALSMAVLVRPTDALLIIPVLFGIGFRPVAWLWLILGGLPGAAFLGFYNHRVYGAIFATGYGDVASAFELRFFARSFGNICRWVPDLLSPLICLGLALPFLKRTWSRDAVILAAWTGLLVAFYSFYFHTGEFWWYLRFILPVFPFLILGAIAVLRESPAPASRWRKALLLALVAFPLFWEVRLNRRLHPVGIAGDEQTYGLSSAWARENLPASSVIVCFQVSGAFFYYTDFLLVRWDQIEKDFIPPLLKVLHDQHRPVYAVLYEFETKDALAKFGGEWDKINTVGKSAIWRRQN